MRFLGWSYLAREKPEDGERAVGGESEGGGELDEEEEEDAIEGEGAELRGGEQDDDRRDERSCEEEEERCQREDGWERIGWTVGWREERYGLAGSLGILYALALIQGWG
eukprot:3898579-Rhodomonas_salina.6